MATIVLPSLRKATEGDEPRPLRGLESSSWEAGKPVGSQQEKWWKVGI